MHPRTFHPGWVSLLAVLAAALVFTAPARAALYTGTTTIYESPDHALVPLGTSATVTALINGGDAQSPAPGSAASGYVALYSGTLTLDLLGLQFTSAMNVWVNCDFDPTCADTAAASSCLGDVTNVTLHWDVPASLPWTGGSVSPQYACIGNNDPLSTLLPSVLMPEIAIPLMDRTTGVPLTSGLRAHTVPITRVNDVPEATSLLLFATALGGLALRSRRWWACQAG